MSVDAVNDIRSSRAGVEIPGSDEIPWEPDYSLEVAIRMLDLVRVRGEVEEHIFYSMGYSRELRHYISEWITSLKGFKYDHQFSNYIVSHGIPPDMVERVASNLEDLVISTTIILSEERVTLTDAMTYTSILKKVLGLGSGANYMASLIIGNGRLRDIASRVALLLLFVLSIYAGGGEEE